MSIWDAYAPGQEFDWSKQQTQAGDYNDPYNLYLSSIPLMQQNANREIQSGLAGLGMSGNRYSKSAQRVGAETGATTSLAMNNMLNQLMFNQANADLDRQVQVGGMLLGATPMVEDALSSRLGFNQNLANIQQQQLNKANSEALQRENMARSDWWRRQTWPMEYLGSMAKGVNPGYPGEPIVKNDSGGTSSHDRLMDYATIAAMFL